MNTGIPPLILSPRPAEPLSVADLEVLADDICRVFALPPHLIDSAYKPPVTALVRVD